MAQLRHSTPEELARLVRELLEGFYWLPGLKPNVGYTRVHDDDDGKFDGFLTVTIGKDGDAWIQPLNVGMSELRFRMPLHGGGSSPRVRTALMILAEAIRLDNEELPQRAPAEVLASRLPGVAHDPLASVRWICKACNTANGADVAVCEGCKKPKPQPGETPTP